MAENNPCDYSVSFVTFSSAIAEASNFLSYFGGKEEV